VYPWDLAASIYEQMGIDPAGTLPLPDGGSVPVSPLAANRNIESGGLLQEIM